MGLSSTLFYSSDDKQETLSRRISLSEEQIEEARNKKDDLLKLLKPEMASATEIPVKHWLQGSYKNHTLIRPVRKGQEFDIDVGLYILCNAEEVGLSALDMKNLNREILEWFTSNRPEAEVSDSKNSCERLTYPASFHIDIPLYYFDKTSGSCKLATQDDEWLDSDPKAIQDWFNEKVKDLSQSSLAKLRRIIKYLKTWTALKSKDDQTSKIPSIAITVLVAELFSDLDDDDDAFIDTSIRVMDFIISNDTLDSPTGSGDLLGFSHDQRVEIRAKASALKNSCEYISTLEDSFKQYILWSATFEHTFPPYIENSKEIEHNTNLPTLTIPPIVRVKHLTKDNRVIADGVLDSVQVYRGDHLYFYVQNHDDYSTNSKVHWMAKNQDKEAMRINDLGHTSVLAIDEERYEGCSYSGTHYMECLVMDNGEIQGISAVRVKVRGFSRPARNPPRKKYFKGK